MGGRKSTIESCRQLAEEPRATSSPTHRGFLGTHRPPATVPLHEDVREDVPSDFGSLARSDHGSGHDRRRAIEAYAHVRQSTVDAGIGWVGDDPRDVLRAVEELTAGHRVDEVGSEYSRKRRRVVGREPARFQAEDFRPRSRGIHAFSSGLTASRGGGERCERSCEETCSSISRDAHRSSHGRNGAGYRGNGS